MVIEGANENVIESVNDMNVYLILPDIKPILDSVIAELDSIENIFNNFRSELLDRQNSYNGVIAQLIDNKLLLKAQVNEQGKFRFWKLENGDYYLYSLLILSGDQDVTRIPAEMYHIYALSSNLIKKYSWMVNVTVQENTAIRLDAQNMSDIF